MSTYVKEQQTMEFTAWSRRAAKVLVAAVAAVAAVLWVLGGSAAAAGEVCPNEALRVENHSTTLPDCRAYELVTNPFKEGFLPFFVAATDDGRLIYRSGGNFANNGLGSPGNLYSADRSAGGWSTTGLAPSGPAYNMGPPSTILSRDLGSSVWNMSRAEQPIGVGDLYLRGPDGAFTRIGPASDADLLAPSAPGGTAVPPVMDIGVSEDLAHVIFPSDFGAAAGGPATDLYEYVGTGNERPRPVGVDNTGQRISSCGASPPGQPSTFHAISTDGRVIFWTAAAPCPASALYARVNGTTTIDASASACDRAPTNPGGACNAVAPPAFQGANAAGTRVYFTTSQQLVNTDTDATDDLYECDIPSGAPVPVGPVNPCPSLHEVSGASSGADVQGVTRISDDGSRVYFVATGVLAPNLGANDATAVAGGANLYVWRRDAAHPNGLTTFVGTLDPGDNELWGVDNRRAQATDDGRYLIFVSRARLIDSGAQADTDTAADVYRYDAEARTVNRVSTGADGTGGNASNEDAQFPSKTYATSLHTPGGRHAAMTDDGSAVVFVTGETLSSADTNGTYDTYLWRDGRVWLISSGGPSSDDVLGLGNLTVTISPSGRDIYFGTTAQLTANDVDTEADIYDARIDGGFDVSPLPACTADACQGVGAAPPASPPRPGTAAAGGEPTADAAAPAFSIKSVSGAQRSRFAATGKVTLAVTTNAPGTVTAKATATIAKRSRTVASARKGVTKASTVSLPLTLSKTARADLAAKGKLTVTVEVRQANVALPRAVTVKLTKAKAAKQHASRRVAAKGGRS